MSKYFFTADEHYGHKNIIEYCQRPFSSIEEMDEILIAKHNEIVSDDSIVVHVGDFTLANRTIAESYVKRLNGSHIFLMGSHDRWLKKSVRYLWQKKINGIYIVCCHYAMRAWYKSHYNSIQLHGHSHGKLKPLHNQYDVGVDNNNYCPVSLEEILDIINYKRRIKND